MRADLSFVVSRRKDETTDREIYCRDCVSARRGGDRFSMLCGGGGSVIKMRGNSILVVRKNFRCKCTSVFVAYSPFIWARMVWVLFLFDKFECLQGLPLGFEANLFCFSSRCLRKWRRKERFCGFQERIVILKIVSFGNSDRRMID